MTPEEKDIKSKIDNLSDLDLFFNDSDLWKRVEGKLDKKKSRKNILALYWAAASIAIGLSFYFFLSPTIPPVDIATTKSTATSTPQLTPEIVIRTKTLIPKVLPVKNSTIPPAVMKDSVESYELNERLLSTDVETLSAIAKPIESTNFKDILQYPVVFKAQRVTSLNFPVIPDQMMERESFAKRALRQIKHFNTEGKIDLRELNIEPRNVWAYLERSFFHDTTKIISSKPLKP
ncbi:hypothetical protein [Emticicia sp. C21]|uniref:hypothetical protein n=1 Tax=Emticicia sp. C21 TaxID=2302915 RepID=UPI000E342FAF|nr:hypothetical protein [Emticicia sp. C21]RFS18412.1 hypothetical protein D0T08_03950 [Emticicia sp. C21]